MKHYLIPDSGRFYKANLHCHTTVSDGMKTPAEIKALYQANGYSIVAFTDHDVPAIAQARLVLECRKMYVDDLRAENFLDKSIVEKWYVAGDFHRAYVMEIVNAYIKE